jgi:hypothetical protein
MGGYLKIYKLLGLLLLITSCSRVSLPSQSNSTLGESAFIENGPILTFKTDKLTNIYCIDNKSELVKYNNKGEKLFSFTDRTLGNIDYLDVSNPLKIICFYRDYQSVVFLDNTLSVTSKIDLPELGFQDVSAIGLSNDNTIWLYDALDSRVKKITREGRIVIESDLLTPFLKDFNPEFIVEANNYLIINDPANGFHLFDTFGKYLNTAKITGLNTIQIKNNKVLFLKDNTIQSWNVDNYERNSYKIIDESLQGVTGFQLMEKNILLLKNGKIIKKAVKN